ncbi:MAG: arylsulfatase [Verrucomicrobiota bacterium]|nr:arylsulfatase [Verrucomicrobiota bacterium]
MNNYKDLLILSSALLSVTPIQAAAPAKPNVIIVLTDDQGMGDFSLYGNPVIKTPHLDALAQEGVSFNQFHVTPMCSPSRAALLTGRNPLENGVISTCQGLHSLREGFPIMPETFTTGGYATGMFGKWHLGRNWPSRPQDRGFQMTVALHGFGTTGISNRWNNDYVDTWVMENGQERQTKGFCTDVLFDEAMAWMDKQAEAGKPFFTYIPTNAVHFPYWAPAEWSAKYSHTLNPEFFAMVANLDDNMGRLDSFLEKRHLKDNTILVFLTDNGPVGGFSTHNAGMTGTKATPWEGGHRVPLFVRYPAGGITGGKVIEGLADVTDLYPTLLELCHLNAPENAKLSGISLAEVMTGKTTIPERLQITQFQRQTLSPQEAAIMWGDWRLLWSDSLYNIKEDLAQKHNVAEEHPDIFARMWREYIKRYYALREKATTAPPECIGSAYQNEVVLDASYWLELRADGQDQVRNGQLSIPEGGAWKIKAMRSGKYEILLRRWPVESGLGLRDAAPPFQSKCSGKPVDAGVAIPIVQASLDLDTLRYTAKPANDPTAVRFEVDITEGEHQLHGVFRDGEGKALCGAFYAYIRLL